MTDSITPVKSSGADDTQAIQRAIDMASASAEGCVLLSGEYQITQPLQVGVSGADGCARIASQSGAVLSFTGNKVDDYAIRFCGKTESPVTRLENISVRCNYRCRGVLLSGQTYGSIARNVLIWHPRQVGMDVIDCWGSSLENIFVDFCYTGTPFRFYRFNAATATQLRARGVSVTRSGGSYSSAISYGMENGGLEAAQEHFGDLRYDWPSDDDEACVGATGRPWNPGIHSASAVFIHTSTGVLFDTLILEGCYYVDWPLVKIYSGSHGTRLHNVYIESCKTLKPLIEVDSDWNTISDVYYHPKTPIDGGIVVQASGTVGNTVHNIHSLK